MGFRVIKGGLLTTVQDFGRYGYQSQGFNVGGVMDARSFRIANLLLDNPENEAVLECTLIGPTLEFTSSQIIAITGGDFRPELNDDPVPMYTAIFVNKGDVLKVGAARTGRTCYIAFSNYLQIPVVMGSRSTNLKSKIGGFKGGSLKTGIISVPGSSAGNISRIFSHGHCRCMSSMIRILPFVSSWDRRTRCSVTRESRIF